MRKIIKIIIHLICQVIVLPFAVLCWVENAFSSQKSEIFFTLWSHFFALFPGIVGVVLRRAYYCFVLNHCYRQCHIGFGTIFSHRRVCIEDHVSIGNYCVIGTAHIGARCEIGSRVSITSGKHQHRKNNDGHWTAFDSSHATQVKIAEDVWIGEGAIIMADIGKGSMIGAGAVVNRDIGPNAVAVGNPARDLKTGN